MPSLNSACTCSSCFSRDCYGNLDRGILSMFGLYWVFSLLASKLTNHSFLRADPVILLGPVWAE